MQAWLLVLRVQELALWLLWPQVLLLVLFELHCAGLYLPQVLQQPRVLGKQDRRQQRVQQQQWEVDSSCPVQSLRAVCLRQLQERTLLWEMHAPSCQTCG